MTGWFPSIVYIQYTTVDVSIIFISYNKWNHFIEKINLKAGEQKTVKFTLSVNDLTFYNPQNLPVWEPGAFEVFIGGNSLATLKTQFSLVQ